MTDFFRSLIEFVVSPVRDLVNATVGRLSALWHSIIGFFYRVRDRFYNFVGGVRRWADSLRRYAISVYLTLRWMTLQFIPQMLDSLSRSIVAWTLTRLGDLQTWASRTVAALRDWLYGLITTTMARVEDAITWTQRTADALLADLKRVKDHVFGVLGSAERLAEWAAGAIFRALWRYVLDNAVAFGRVLYAARVKVALEVAETTEAIVTRII